VLAEHDQVVVAFSGLVEDPAPRRPRLAGPDLDRHVQRQERALGALEVDARRVRDLRRRRHVD
jgi:hypothetical protein